MNALRSSLLAALLLMPAALKAQTIFHDGFEQRIETRQKPALLPRLDELRLYTRNSFWYQPIGPAPQYAADEALLQGSLRQASGILLLLRQYTAPVYFADRDTPRHDVVVACGASFDLGVSVLQQVPIPDWAEPGNDADGAGRPVPTTGCGEDAEQDNNMVVIDVERRCEFDFWQARRVNGVWHSGLPTQLPLDSNGVFANAVSSRASGLAFLGGVIWPDELAAGRIGHALAFSHACTRSGGPVAPATASDGITPSASALPIGARIQLDPALDLDTLALSTAARSIGRALQEYGGYLVDTGGDCGSGDAIGLYAIDPKSATDDPYQGLLPAADYVDIALPLHALRVLAFGPQNPDWSEAATIVNGPCSDYR
jgi:hypothetical protein